MNNKEPWFISQRGEYIAGVILSRRDDVHIEHSHATRGHEFDYLIYTNPKQQDRAPVAVEVKSFLKTTLLQQQRIIKSCIRNLASSPLPVILLMVDVDNENCTYIWVRSPDPFAPDQLKTLHYDEIKLHRFTSNSYASVIKITRDYYSAKG